MNITHDNDFDWEEHEIQVKREKKQWRVIDYYFNLCGIIIPYCNHDSEVDPYSMTDYTFQIEISKAFGIFKERRKVIWCGLREENDIFKSFKRSFLSTSQKELIENAKSQIPWSIHFFNDLTKIYDQRKLEDLENAVSKKYKTRGFDFNRYSSCGVELSLTRNTDLTLEEIKKIYLKDQAEAIKKGYGSKRNEIMQKLTNSI